MFMLNLFYKIFRRLNSYYYCLKYRSCFKYLGHNVRVYSPLKIQGHTSIVVYDNAIISDQIWLAALPLTGVEAKLVIGKNVHLGHFNHIYCTSNITIEQDVLTADKVYISDNAHSYENIYQPIWRLPIKQLKDVVIGEGSWIGENVCIIGASVGKHCVIGANTVVTKDIPDYSIAVGVPARVIKKYNIEKQIWEVV